MTAIAFDIDGTIFDCGDIVADAFREGARIFGEIRGLAMSNPSRDEIMGVVGIPTEEIFRRLYPEAGSDGRHELMRLCQKALSDMVRGGGGILFEGVKEVFEKLNQDSYRFFAASNGTLEYITAILETHGLMRYFHQPLIVIGGGIRNKSDIVRYYIDKVLDGEPVIMVGDRISDLEAARDNNIPFIACAFGHMGTSEIEGERWIARHFREIPALVKEIEAEIGRY